MFSSCSGPGPTFGRCCAHWSLGETRSGRRLPAAPHACECEALDRGNKGSIMRTVSFLVSSSQDMDHAGVWPPCEPCGRLCVDPRPGGGIGCQPYCDVPFSYYRSRATRELSGEERCSTACGGFYQSEKRMTKRFDRSCLSGSIC